jgi:hypothetical protein
MLPLDSYWKLVRPSSPNRREEIPDFEAARNFFYQEFPDANGTNSSDPKINKYLFSLYKSTSAPQESRRLAECCLRCCISNHISVQSRVVSRKIYQRFGEEHGFTFEDLLSYVLHQVLTDSNPTIPYSEGQNSVQMIQEHIPLSIKILRSYEPEVSSLATWTARRYEYDKVVSQFLLDYGVLVLSDWAILNDVKLGKVRQIFTEIYPRPEAEVQQICSLLEGYHAVYRSDRRAQPKSGRNRTCAPPTPEQLQKISQWSQNQGIHLAPEAPETVLEHLQNLASALREYRIQVNNRGFSVDRSRVIKQSKNDAEGSHHLPIQELIPSLSQAIAITLSEQLHKLHTLTPPEDRLWIVALYLVHCQRMSMKAIAPMLNLKAQSQVSRLLKLKEFRADIRSCTIGLLKARFLPVAQEYATPDRLIDLDQKLEEALGKQVNEIIQEAGAEINAANRQMTSLFARTLCQHLDTYRETYHLDEYHSGENHSTSQSDTQRNQQQNHQETSGELSHE